MRALAEVTHSAIVSAGVSGDQVALSMAILSRALSGHLLTFQLTFFSIVPSQASEVSRTHIRAPQLLGRKRSARFRASAPPMPIIFTAPRPSPNRLVHRKFDRTMRPTRNALSCGFSRSWIRCISRPFWSPAMPRFAGAKLPRKPRIMPSPWKKSLPWPFKRLLQIRRPARSQSTFTTNTSSENTARPPITGKKNRRSRMGSTIRGPNSAQIRSSRRCDSQVSAACGRRQAYHPSH
jgi:hypothetical protein